MTTTCCVGPAGPAGPAGAAGAVGPAGAAGPPGAALANLDDLRGLACNAGGLPGVVTITYGPPPASLISMACVPPPVALTVTNVFGNLDAYGHPLHGGDIASGTVTSDVGGISCGTTCTGSYVRTTIVTLTESPAVGSYFTGWERIVHGEVVEERIVAADRGQSQFVNLELQNCMRLVAVDLQNRSVKNDFSDVTIGWSFSPICLG